MDRIKAPDEPRRDVDVAQRARRLTGARVRQAHSALLAAQAQVVERSLVRDYRGEVLVLLVDLGERPYTIASGTRIAQLVIAAVAPTEAAWATELPPSGRGAGGFGSTGR